MTAGSITHPGGPLVIILCSVQFGFKHEEFVCVCFQAAFLKLVFAQVIQGGSNMTGNDFFLTVIAHHSSNSQTGLNRF